MLKLAYTINTLGFNAILFMFGIGLYVGKFLYKVVLTPILFVLWQLAKLMPEEKADPTPDPIPAPCRAMCYVMDNVVFKTKELECEKWLKEHPEFN